MSLEEAVRENTVAIRDLISALGGVRGNVQLSEYNPPKEPAGTLQEVADAAKKMGDSMNIESMTPKSAEASVQTGESSSPAATYDDVKRVTTAVSNVSRSKAIAALSRFGVATAKALKEEQWPEYVMYMTRVQKGEVDPEASHE